MKQVEMIKLLHASIINPVLFIEFEEIIFVFENTSKDLF